jgi:hypothetical protein
MGFFNSGSDKDIKSKIEKIKEQRKALERFVSEATVDNVQSALYRIKKNSVRIDQIRNTTGRIINLRFSSFEPSDEKLTLWRENMTLAYQIRAWLEKRNRYLNLGKAVELAIRLDEKCERLYALKDMQYLFGALERELDEVACIIDNNEMPEEYIQPPDPFEVE